MPCRCRPSRPSLRSQLQSASSGNVRAQRDILAMIRDIERVRSITGLFDNGGAEDVVADIDDANAIDGDDSDVDDTANADRDDAGDADDDEPTRKQAEGIDTYGERRQEERGVLHPPLKGEGRTAEGSPGWGDGRATDDSDAEFAEPLSPPPGPLTRADLPPPGGGEEAWEPAAPPAVSAPQPEDAAAPPAGRKPSLPSDSGSGQRRGVLPRRSGPERSAAVQPAPLQPGRRRRSPAVNAGKIREGHSGSSQRSPGRTNPGPGPGPGCRRARRAPAAPAERDEKLKTRC
jgi:hypothetical protein